MFECCRTVAYSFWDCRPVENLDPTKHVLISDGDVEIFFIEKENTLTSW